MMTLFSVAFPFLLNYPKDITRSLIQYVLIPLQTDGLGEDVEEKHGYRKSSVYGKLPVIIKTIFMCLYKTTRKYLV